MVGCLDRTVDVKETWIKVVGIPLHLWSQYIFREIGQFCVGWIATVEETELKNHLKWARILIANNGRSLPKEVAITCDGITYHFPIWAEGKVRTEVLPKKRQ